MNAYCPQCETDLDQATGICPACRWDPAAAARAAQILQAAQDDGPQLSLTERYRGTRFDHSVGQVAVSDSGVSRGRAFVAVALIAGVGLYGVVMSAMGVF